jgi:UDP-glucose 4-epimerase
MMVLVCGGAGYVGSHTVKELHREGFEPVVFDNFSTGRRELLLGTAAIAADLMNRDALREAFRSVRFEAVLHFASLIQVGESYQHPLRYYSHNLSTSLNLIEAMLEAGVKKLIFSSSAAVYGVPETTPIPESHPLNPSNPYGQSKLFVERILQDSAEAYGLKFISLRYFNAAGADPDGRLGEMHDPETHLIPNILLYLLGKKEAFELFGTDYPTSDGTAIRDYVHVTDLAAAHVLALRRLLRSSESDSINLGTNLGHSVLEVIRTVEEITGLKVAFRAKPRRKGDVAALLASKDKAERILGWKPRHSSLEKIVETAWKWHSRPPAGAGSPR